MCDLTWCKTRERGTIQVFESIGDGSFNCSICEDCADRLGIREYDDLPEAHIVRQRPA